jgi:DnaJ-class molecular chaperone
MTETDCDCAGCIGGLMPPDDETPCTGCAASGFYVEYDPVVGCELAWPCPECAGSGSARVRGDDD